MIKSIEWKKRKYLQACRILDMFNERYNICNIRTKDDTLICNGCIPNISNSLCCARCNHLGKNGCTVQSLGCKMHYCYFGRSLSENKLCEEDSELNKAHKVLSDKIRTFIQYHKIPGYRMRMSMEDSFKFKFKKKLVAYSYKDYNSDTATWDIEKDEDN